MRVAALMVMSVVFPTSLAAQPALLNRAPLADTPSQLEAQITDALMWEDDQPGDQKGRAVCEAYKALFKMVGPAGIPASQTAGNDSIAIQAAWQDVALSATKDKDADHDRPLDRQKVNWFLGFLEGRTHSKLPPWWAKLLLDSRANRQSEVYVGLPTNDLYHDAGFDHVRAPLDTTLARDGDKLILRVGDEFVELRRELLPQAQKTGVWCEVSALITTEKAYIAVHDHRGSPFQLTCLDRASGVVRWKTTVLGTIWNDSTGDPPKAYVSVIEQGARVLVFGGGRWGANVEAFQAKDGVNLFRFATSYVW